jgi:ribosomal protein S20
MPIIKSAIKRARQTAKRRERNVGIKKEVKSAIKAFMDKPSAQTLAAAHSEIDTAFKKNLIKKNTAARRKSNLAKLAKAKGVKLATAKAEKTAKPAAKKVSDPATTAKKTVAKKPVAKKAPAKKAAPKK